MKISNCKYDQSVNSNKLAKLRFVKKNKYYQKKKNIQVLLYSSYILFIHNNFVLFVCIIIPSTDVFFFIYTFNVDCE